MSKLNDTERSLESLEALISERRIEYYEYSDFNDIQPIGKNSLGSVFRVTWKNNTTRYFALKSFYNNEQTLKQFVKELTIHQKVNIHENIIRFYGITNVKTGAIHQMKEYALVLEYADSGMLNTYLKNHFDELDWNDKLRLAFQLASAVECMHCCGIIHRDLHAGNVLIHQKNIKLADFGLSKKIAEGSSDLSNVFGIIPYMDPKNFNDKQYRLNEKSDIYSFGVLMWQISSGRQPFENQGYGLLLSIAVVKGLREEIINETPKEYSDLYKECWNYEPNDRPNIHSVVSTLKEMMFSKQHNAINESFLQSESDINNDSSISSLEPYRLDLALNSEIPDINEDLSISSSVNNLFEIGTSSSKFFQSSMVETKMINSTNLSRNTIELKLGEDGFITPDDKAEELIKNLTKPKYLCALKLLFENLQNEFSPQILRDSLVALADPTPFDYYTKQSVARLELHLRTWVAVLERICFSPIRLSKELRDKAYNSLAKFAEIHQKTTRVVEEGLENNFKSKFNQFNQQKSNEDDKIIIKKCNYNIDFLLIHLRDTLHSLRDDETWFQEIIRRAKELLKVALNITPGVLSTLAPGIALPNDNCSILSMLAQLRQGLSFKYPVASYYMDWRIMLIIQNNLFTWSESSEKIISKKFGGMVLMEYLWSFLEREWIDVSDKAILDSQTKFDEVSNKVSSALQDTKSFLNNLVGNEPLALPHTLWFGILDLAQNLIQKSTRTSIYGLCYYLAIESLNQAPSSFIQFKAIEILLHLHNIDNQMFSMIEIDFDQYSQKLNENNSTDSLEKFQNLLIFVKEKYFEDLKILKDNIGKGKGKGKGLEQNTHLKGEQISNSNKIIGVIADEMTCPISCEPSNQLCILKCQHILSLNNLNKLKQKICPECREEIEDNDIRYLPQNTIYKNLYSQFFNAGHILPSIELEDSKHDHYDSDSDNSEVDLILTKKRQFIKAFKLNSNVLLSSILPRISKKQHPTYQNVMKELDEKNYEKAEHWCKEFLKKFPKSYSMRCILAYTYRCLNNYEQAHLYLDEAIDLRPKHPIAFFIRGEINFRQNEYKEAINNLKSSISYKAKINNLYIVLGNSYLCSNYYDNYTDALAYYNIALKNDPNNYLCLKNCAHVYEKQEKYLNTLEMLNKLLIINEEDSLILCYYGEILKRLGRYDEAILYFTKANIIDPENVHSLNRRAMTYYVLQEYDNALFDFNKVIQLDSLNDIAYYYKGLIYCMIGNSENAAIAFKKCIELDSEDKLSKMQLYYVEYLRNNNITDGLKYDIMTKINQISNINSDKSSLLIRCKIYIELNEYERALLDFNRLFELNHEDISFIHLLRNYSDYWSYVYKYYRISDSDFTNIEIDENFNKYMYKVKKVYFISNIHSSLLENDINSLTKKSFNAKDVPLNLELKLSLPYVKSRYLYIVWKTCISLFCSKSTSVNFAVEMGMKPDHCQEKKEHKLTYDDLSRLIGLGWIEYTVPIKIEANRFDWIKPSIKTYEYSINMKIDYVRFTQFERDQVYFPKIGHLLPIYKTVPDAFEDEYFSKKETENLIKLEDIIN